MWTFQCPLQLEDGSLPDVQVNLCGPCSPCFHAIVRDPLLSLHSPQWPQFILCSHPLTRSAHPHQSVVCVLRKVLLSSLDFFQSELSKKPPEPHRHRSVPHHGLPIERTSFWSQTLQHFWALRSWVYKWSSLKPESELPKLTWCLTISILPYHTGFFSLRLSTFLGHHWGFHWWTQKGLHSWEMKLHPLHNVTSTCVLVYYPFPGHQVQTLIILSPGHIPFLLCPGHPMIIKPHITQRISAWALTSDAATKLSSALTNPVTTGKVLILSLPIFSTKKDTF